MKELVKPGLMLLMAAMMIVACGKQSTDFTYTTKSSEALKLFNQGLDELDMLQLDRARGLFDQALAKDPDFAMAHFYRAQTAVSGARSFQFSRELTDLPLLSWKTGKLPWSPWEEQ